MIPSVHNGRVELVIFDCDGVLVDSEPISNRVLAEMLSAQGLPTTPTEARRDFEGKLLKDVVRLAEKRLGRSLPDGWLADFERTRAHAFARELRPVPGAAEVVQGVRAAGVDVCVASQGKLAKTRLTLGLTHLCGLFPDGALFSADSVRRGKPHPDLFLHAASRMEVSPGRTVVVEDTPSGIKAAVSADMRAIGYAKDTPAKRLTNAGAGATLESLEELPEVLGL